MRSEIVESVKDMAMRRKLVESTQVAQLIKRVCLLESALGNFAARLEAIAPINPVTERFGIIETVKAIVSGHYHVSIPTIMSEARWREASWARSVGMHLAIKFAPGRQNDVERSFNRTHGALIYALNHVRDRIAAEPSLAQEIKSLEEVVRNATGKTS